MWREGEGKTRKEGESWHVPEWAGGSGVLPCEAEVGQCPAQAVLFFFLGAGALYFLGKH